MLTEGLTSFHFPFSIQSITVEGKKQERRFYFSTILIFAILGSIGVQDCIPCPPGKIDQIEYERITSRFKMDYRESQRNFQKSSCTFRYLCVGRRFCYM